MSQNDEINYRKKFKKYRDNTEKRSVIISKEIVKTQKETMGKRIMWCVIAVDQWDTPNHLASILLQIVQSLVIFKKLVNQQIKDILNVDQIDDLNYLETIY